MAVTPIKPVKKGDKDRTLMHASVANEVINRVSRKLIAETSPNVTNATIVESEMEVRFLFPQSAEGGLDNPVAPFEFYPPVGIGGSSSSHPDEWTRDTELIDATGTPLDTTDYDGLDEYVVTRLYWQHNSSYTIDVLTSPSGNTLLTGIHRVLTYVYRLHRWDKAGRLWYIGPEINQPVVTNAGGTALISFFGVP